MWHLLWWLLATAHAEPTNTTRRTNVLPKTWLFGSANDRLKKMRVALLMAGNVRTHDQCAPSIRKNLLEHKYNDRWRFEIVALAYEERFGHAIHKDAKSKTWKPGEVVKDVDIRKHYLTWPCHVKVVTAESVEKSIKKTPSSPMFNGSSRPALPVSSTVRPSANFQRSSSTGMGPAHTISLLRAPLGLSCIIQLTSEARRCIILNVV